MQITRQRVAGVNLNVREEDYLKYASLYFPMSSKIILELFLISGLDGHCTCFLSFLLPCPHFPCPTALVIHPQRLALAEEGAVGAQRCFQGPCPGGSPALPQVSSSLEQWGEVFEPLATLQSPCLCVAPLSMCYRIEGCKDYLRCPFSGRGPTMRKQLSVSKDSSN